MVDVDRYHQTRVDLVDRVVVKVVVVVVQEEQELEVQEYNHHKHKQFYPTLNLEIPVDFVQQQVHHIMDLVEVAPEVQVVMETLVDLVPAV